MVPEFLDDNATLPHAVDTSSLDHFDGVEIPLAPDRDRIDVLIGQSNKALLAVLEEREGADTEEPNYVLTRLGPVASGGRVRSKSNSVSAFHVSVEPLRSQRCCNELQQEIGSLKETIREYELQDRLIQPSRTDELAKSLVEPHISVVNGRYEMPVPFKTEMLKKLLIIMMAPLNTPSRVACGCKNRHFLPQRKSTLNTPLLLLLFTLLVSVHSLNRRSVIPWIG